jgi:hypothetical protein
MTERTAALALLAATTGELRAEIQYLVDLDRDDAEDPAGPYDMVDAFRDILDRVDEPEYATPAFRRDVRRLAVALGVYRVVTDRELARTVVSRGPKYDFKLDGRKYVFERHL